MRPPLQASSAPPMRRLAALFLVLLGVLAVSWSGGIPAVADDGYEPDPQLIADVRSYAQETERGYDHVLRWVRVLKTFDELDDMTASEAQDYADRGWERWEPVVAELEKLKDAPGDYQPDQQVVADVRSYAQETDAGYEHVLRWMRTLKSFGALDDMTSAEAQEYADRGWVRWEPVADELAELEASTAEPESTPEPTPTPEPNRAPVVDTSAATYADFVRTRNGARGVSVWKMFQGIFSDPDGDELTYTASVPAHQLHLVDSLSIHFDVTVSGGELADFLSITVDGDDDWKAASPALADPLVVTATLTATDPEGLSASLSGDFLVNWDSNPALVSATSDGAAIELTFDQALESNPAPEPGQFTVRVVNGDGSSLAVAVSRVSVNGAVVTLELASALSAGQTVVLDYAHDDDTPLQRAGGGDPAPGFTGQAVALTVIGPPDSPANLEISSEPGKLDVSVTWDAAEGATSYRLSWRQVVPDGQAGGFSGAGNTATATVSGTSADFTVPDYGRWMVQLQACNDAGCGSATGGSHFVRSGPEAQQNDTTPPSLVSAAVNGTTLTLTFDEALDTASTPAGSAFSVSETQADTTHTIAGTGTAAISGMTATVTLAARVTRGSAVKVSYTKPTSNPLQDAAGNDVADFSGQSLTNNTPLVSNTGQSVDGTARVALFWRAASFTTGSIEGGYTLSGVGLLISAWGGNADHFTAQIYSTNSAGRPDSPLHTLTNPATPTDGAVNTFTAPPGATLDPSTTYFLVLKSATGNTVVVSSTDSDDEDSGAPLGWSTGNDRYSSSDQGANWSTNTRVPMFAVKGGRTDMTVVDLLDFGGGCTGCPGTPANGTAKPGPANGQITLNWRSAAGSTQTSWKVGHRETESDDAFTFDTVTDENIGTYTFKNLDVFKFYDVQVQGVNTTGSGGVARATWLLALDDPPPAFSGAAVDGTTLTVTFDKALDTGSAPAGSAFSVSATQGGTTRTIAGTGTVSISGADVTVTLASEIVVGETVTVSYTKPATNPIQDAAGNAAADFTDQPVTNTDTTPPAVSSAAVDGTTLTVTFDEALDVASAPAGSAFRVTATPSGGSARTVAGTATAAISGAKVTVTLADAVAAGETVTVSYTKPASNPLQDTAGNAVADFSETVTNKTLAPGVVVKLVSNTGQTSADTNARVRNDHAQSFTTGSHTVGYNLTGVDLVYEDPGNRAGVPTFTVEIYTDSSGVPGTSLGELTLGQHPHVGVNKYRDRAGGGGIDLDAETKYWVVIDVTADGTSQLDAKVTESNGEDPGAATGWSIGDGRLWRTMSGTDWNTHNDDVLKIALHGSAEKPPTVSSAAVDGTTLTVTFDEALDVASAPAGSAFRVTATPSGGSARTIAGTGTAAISGAKVTVTLDSAVAAGETVTVSYTKPASNPLQDTAGNAVADFSETVTNKTLAPGVVVKLVSNTGQTSADTNATLDNDHAQSFTTGSHSDGYTLTRVRLVMGHVSGTLALFNVSIWSDASGSPGTSLGTLTLTSSGGHVSVGINDFDADSDGIGLAADTTYWVVIDVTTQSNPPNILWVKRTESNGEDPGAATGWSIGDGRLWRTMSGTDWNTHTDDVLKIAVHGSADATPPVFSGAAVNGTTLTVTFDEALDPGSAPAGSAFSVTATPSGGTTRTIAGTGTATISGNTATVTLAGAVVHGETVTVSYTKPATNPLQDMAGDEAASFTDQTVTNNTPDTTPPAFTSASVDGTSLTVTFDEELDTGSPPTGTAFRVRATGPTGRARTIAGTGTASLSGMTVTVTLADAVASDERLTLSYSTPRANPLRDLAGNVATNFSNRPVTNATRTELVNARVRGSELVLTFNGPLDPGTDTPGGSFAVTKLRSPDPPILGTGTVTISGATVTVPLERLWDRLVDGSLDFGRTVTVSYTAPDSNPLLNFGGGEVPSFDERLVTSWWNATAFRSTVELRYPRSLNLHANSVPDAGDFELTLSECRADTGRHSHCYTGGDWSRRRTLELSDTDPVRVQPGKITLTLAEPLEFPWHATSDLLVSYTPGDNPIRHGDGDGEATGFTELRLFNDGRHTSLPTDHLEREFLVEETVKMFRVGNREHPWYTTQRAERLRTSTLRVVYILNYHSKTGLLVNHGAHHVQPPTEVWCAWAIPGNTSQCHSFYPRPWPIVGTSATETLIGGDGNDYIYGLDGDDLISGGDGDDRLIGGNGRDNLQGNDGDDRLIGGPGGDTLHGGDGNDTADYSGSNAAVTVNLGSSTYSGGHAEGDALISIENIIGSAHADDIRGNSGNNRLIGGAGGDTMSGAAGNDTLIGGAGDDELLGRTGDDRLEGGDGSDTLVGGDDNDILTGGAGHDVLNGGPGADILNGGKGIDTLTGGNGVDVFNFHLGAGDDTIKDYDLTLSEAINLCMGSASNIPGWHVDDNDAGNLVITVTLNGETAATITLEGVSVFDANIDNLNVVVHTSAGPSCAH